MPLTDSQTHIPWALASFPLASTRYGHFDLGMFFNKQRAIADKPHPTQCPMTCNLPKSGNNGSDFDAKSDTSLRIQIGVWGFQPFQDRWSSSDGGEAVRSLQLLARIKHARHSTP